MGGGDLAAGSRPTIFAMPIQLAGPNAENTLGLFGVALQSWLSLLLLALIVAVAALVLRGFLASEVGLALRAVGDNAAMARAQGVDDRRMTILGLVIANASIGVAGGLLAQYDGFANVQMGVGALVTGLAGVLLGEAVLAQRGLTRLLIGAIVGTVLFRMIVAAAIRLGLAPNALKLTTAVLVLSVLGLRALFDRAVNSPRVRESDDGRMGNASG
jgi:putative ABC transport system permease protein